MLSFIRRCFGRKRNVITVTLYAARDSFAEEAAYHRALHELMRAARTRGVA